MNPTASVCNVIGTGVPSIGIPIEEKIFVYYEGGVKETWLAIPIKIVNPRVSNISLERERFGKEKSMSVRLK